MVSTTTTSDNNHQQGNITRMTPLEMMPSTSAAAARASSSVDKFEIDAEEVEGEEMDEMAEEEEEEDGEEEEEEKEDELDSTSGSLDYDAYELLEFTSQAKSSLIALLNSMMPELTEPLEAPLNTSQANLYFRLGSLAQFFNSMTNAPEQLFIKDLPPMPSGPRHMNEARVDNVHRYIRFWLGQFYGCTEVIESLSQFPEHHLCMTAMLTLTLLHTVRHALPQVAALLTQPAHWSPALDAIARRLAPLIRHDILTALLSQQLEQERIAHYEARKAAKKAAAEAADLRTALEKSKAAGERLKGMLERANHQLQEMAAINQANGGGQSLLNNSNGTTSSSTSGSSKAANSLIAGQPIRRGRGRPRKNPAPGGAFSASTGLANLRPIKPRLAPIGTNRMLIDGANNLGIQMVSSPQQYQQQSTSAGGGSSLLSTIVPIMVHQSQSQSQSQQQQQQPTLLRLGPGQNSLGGPILIQQQQLSNMHSPPPSLTATSSSAVLSPPPQSLLMKSGVQFAPISPPTPPTSTSVMIEPQSQPSTSTAQVALLKPKVKGKVGRKKKIQKQPQPKTSQPQPQLPEIFMPQAEPQLQLPPVIPEIVQQQQQKSPSFSIATEANVRTYFVLVTPTDNTTGGDVQKTTTDSTDHQLVQQVPKCLLCRKTYPSLSAYEQHYSETHLNAKVFGCDWKGCERLFLSKHKLDRHRRCHTGERPFACDRCGRRYPRMDKLKDHAKKCTGVAVDKASTASTTSTGISTDTSEEMVGVAAKAAAAAAANRGGGLKRKTPQTAKTSTPTATAVNSFKKKRTVVTRKVAAEEAKKAAGEVKGKEMEQVELEVPAEEAKLLEAELEKEVEQELMMMEQTQEMDQEEVEGRFEKEEEAVYEDDSTSQPDLVIAEETEEVEGNEGADGEEGE